MNQDVHELPDLEDLYPVEVLVKHKGYIYEVGLAVVKGLEAHGIMNNRDFILDLHAEPERMALRFRSRKPAKWLKDHKKEIRNGAISS